VLPALIRKFHEAKVSGAPSVTLWGSGSPRREFLHVDDLATACIHLMQHYNEKLFVNVGTGEDLTILELAQIIQRTVGFEGDLVTDPSKPDGTPRKLMDVSRINSFGWRHTIGLETGIAAVYEEFKTHIAKS
jgi:GDP-L-fucose synthase